MKQDNQPQHHMLQSISAQYDYNKFPPDLELALIHAQSRKMGPPTPNKEEEICRCCDQPIYHQEISTFSDTDSYQHGGVGFPLFFQLARLKMGFIIMLILFLGIPLMTLNYLGGECLYNLQVYNLTIPTRTVPCDGNSSIQESWLRNVLRYNNITYWNDYNLSQSWCLKTESYFHLFILDVQNRSVFYNNDSNQNYTDYREKIDKYTCEGLRSYQQLSILNNRNSLNQRKIKAYIVLVSVVASVAYLQLVRIKAEQKTIQCDLDLVTPQDFTVMLRGLPRKYTKKELKNYIEQKEYIDQYKKVCKFEVEEIDIAYDIYKYYVILEKQSELNIQMCKLMQNNQDQKNPTLREKIDRIHNELLDLKNQEDDLESKVFSEQYDQCTSIAFVTFKSDIQKDIFLEAYRNNFKSKLKKFLSSEGSQTLQFNNHKIVADDAPDPKDVIWKNCGVEGKLFKRFLFNMIGISAIGCFFGILLCFQLLKNMKQIKKFNALIVPMISGALSLSSGLVNFYFSTVLKLLAAQEVQSTITLMNKSICTKLILAYIFNQGLMVLLSNQILRVHDNSPFSDQVEVRSGLADDVMWIFLLNTYVSSFLNYFNIGYGVKLIMRRKLKQNPESSVVTQAEANKIFEGQQLDLFNKYAFMMKCMLVGSFYCSMVPLCLVLILISFFIYYYTEKYLFANRYALPYHSGDELNKDIIEWMEWIPFMIQLGSFLVDWSLYPSRQTNGDFEKTDDTTKSIQFTAFTISLGNILFGHWFYKLMFQKTLQLGDVKYYRDVCDQFSHTYASTNPVTKDITKQIKNTPNQIIPAIKLLDLNLEVKQQSSNYVNQNLQQFSPNKAPKNLDNTTLEIELEDQIFYQKFERKFQEVLNEFQYSFFHENQDSN